MNERLAEQQMVSSSRIFVAGHLGLVGSAICRRLRAEGFPNLMTRSRGELDLRNQEAVHKFFEETRPEYVFLGGFCEMACHVERPTQCAT